MDKAHNVSRFLVVTPNIVVGEDLRETLLEYAGTEVDVRTSLADDWSHDYRLAIFGVSVDRLLNDPRVRTMHKSGVQIVVLNGHFPKSALSGTGILALSQPFVTSDVEELLRDAGVLSFKKIQPAREPEEDL